MKKNTSLILVALMLLTNLICLISCKHECSFAEEWTADNTSHWHICSDKKCEEIADKADHTWNDGEITTKPTQEADGVKTFTCTVCAKTRDESVAFTGLTEEEWNKVVCEEAFNNATFTEEAVVNYSGVTVVTKATTKFTDEKVFVSITAAGQSNSQTITGSEAKDVKKQVLEQTLSMLQYSDYEYDAENKIYVLTGEFIIHTLNTKADSATIRFENGKLVEFNYTCKIVSQGMIMDATATTLISDYGTTTID